LRERQEQLAGCIARSWDLNRRLDPGTDPPAVREIFARINDHLAAGKLLGAGGGGYALFLAKDASAGQEIRRILEANPPNRGARFVDFAISSTGLQITRS
jgi:galactokinase/mevalonate kinase-like predicted kinase